MATYEITAPDGQTYEVTAPDGASQDAVLAYAKTQFSKSAPKESTPWTSVAGDAVSNIIPSTFNLVKGVAEAVMSPVETAKGVLDVAAGGLQNALPQGVVDYINKAFPSESAEEAQAKASAVGKFYADRYGSMEGFKRALGKDPAGVMADAATVLSGGAGVARLAGAPGVGQALTTASRAIDPLLQTARGAEAIARPAGRGLASVLGGIGTHTGGESIRQMAQAGYEGGAKAKVAASQMRETAPITDLLDSASAALQNIKAQRGAEYTNAMRAVSADKTVLPFSSIDSAVNNALNIKQFKGVSISPTTAGVQQELSQLVAAWKARNPADFHTAEGLDALKQAIGDIRDATEYGSPSRKVADSVYNSVRSEIVKQAPDYAKVMEKYSEASELISEIQRHLLGKEKGSPITAIRKLQGLMAAGGKNKQMEMSLAKQLEAAGAPNLLAGLSGVSMQDWVPRMLSGRLGAGIGTAIVAANNPVVAGALLPLQSPRLVGEAALATGKAAGMLGRGINAGRQATGGMFGQMPYDLYLYQANQLAQQGKEEQQ